MRSRSGTQSGRDKPTADVGIKAFEIYFPKCFVSQTRLEEHDKQKGKYTQGLGQLEMGFCMDNEDVCSAALTVTAALLENYEIDPRTIGYLCVGTETLIDKSKSVKTVLMDLFKDNSDIEGVDIKNACYGGTQAVFSAVDWIYANYAMEQRFAIAVLVDIAVYAEGPARCTGGAGAMAFLIGPDAPIVFEKGLRGCYMSNIWDFYKPVGGVSTEYPTVNGNDTLRSYLNAVDECYATYKDKSLKHTGAARSLEDFHGAFYHSPYYGLVKKAFARMAFTDYCEGATVALENVDELQELRRLDRENTYDRDYSVKTIAAAKSLIDTKLEPYMELNRRVGNMYTPSVYAQLVCLINRSQTSADLNDKRILLFSYGSGCASAMFSVHIKLADEVHRFEFEKMRNAAKRAFQRLEQRTELLPEEFKKAVNLRDDLIKAGAPYTPVSNDDVKHLFPGTYYLIAIDDMFRRSYERLAKE
ncbi:HMG CoA synthase [Aphelenchoides avenae]|nr:HMG CoA synthase [Aphelenchus avenae]